MKDINIGLGQKTQEAQSDTSNRMSTETCNKQFSQGARQKNKRNKSESTN